MAPALEAAADASSVLNDARPLLQEAGGDGAPGLIAAVKSRLFLDFTAAMHRLELDAAERPLMAYLQVGSVLSWISKLFLKVCVLVP